MKCKHDFQRLIDYNAIQNEPLRLCCTCRGLIRNGKFIGVPPRFMFNMREIRPSEYGHPLLLEGHKNVRL